MMRTSEPPHEGIVIPDRPQRRCGHPWLGANGSQRGRPFGLSQVGRLPYPDSGCLGVAAMGAIRLALAWIVALDHFRVIALTPRSIGLDTLLPNLGLNGGIAVMLFYVISGFLISTA